jgi:Ser/Thr protein kinase RdoA (MazF antagonist)
MRDFETLSLRGQVGRLRRLAASALVEYPVRPSQLVAIAHDENTTFLVDESSGDRFVLRIHRVTGSPLHPPRTPVEIRSELSWLSALRRDTQLSVPEPITALDGSLVTSARVEGVPKARACVLFRWRPGRFLDAGLRPKHLDAVGRLMAQMHDHSVRWPPPVGFRRWRIGLITEELASFARNEVDARFGPDAAAIVEETIDLARMTQEELGTTVNHFGLIHGDLHQENFLFHKGAIGAIDFDDCGWGWFAYDLAVPLSELRTRSDYDGLREALLRGYRSVRPFPVDHERHVEAFHGLRVLQLTLWLIEQREHPAFRRWESHVREGLDELARLHREPRKWTQGDSNP